MTALLSQPDQVIILPDIPSWGFEVAALKDSRSLRIGIDATRPLLLRDKIIRTSRSNRSESSWLSLSLL
jgi:hypothetical protein